MIAFDQKCYADQVSPGIIFLLSGDDDHQETLEYLRKRGHIIIVLYPGVVSLGVLKAADRSYNYIHLMTRLLRDCGVSGKLHYPYPYEGSGSQVGNFKAWKPPGSKT